MKGIRTTLQIVRICERHTERKDFDSSAWSKSHDILYSKRWISEDALFNWAKDNPDSTLDNFLEEVNFKRFVKDED